ncbi:ABC transporter ATP-binding protein [Agromyces seonyuensis]|uniref:ATP-binding cassette domain-containing protein n=1 Tax=Agromyces seonyuensis TaxID=2662446 RepID=A0A6I4P3B9_9MICO|nr:ABC transporter ATP-binding protein [Agromyces seonyuensis]MWB99315.1 ATP-binding cassette domain-containing protein [Agromyces seonyuensis]
MDATPRSAAHAAAPAPSPDAAATPPPSAPPTAPAHPTPRLAVDGLTVAFGGLTALDDVGFAVEAGQILALIGPNGAGKTTAFNAVCGLVRPKSGRILLDGAPAPARPSLLRDHGVARTLQGLGLFDGLSVLDHVRLPQPQPRGRAAGERARAELERHGLGDLADRPVQTLPYPERKRVALARALVADPRLLLLDEPAGGLGEDDIDALGRTVREVAAGGCAVLLVEHHVDFVLGLADRVVVLDFGRVIAAGSPEAIRGDAAVEAAYLGLQASA